MAKLLLFNKPFKVLSQFSPDGAKQTLKDYITIQKVYPAGRLDYDSEGLLLLTDNGPLQHRISHPKKKMPKTYWAQVEGKVSSQAIELLCGGITLKDGLTRPAQVSIIEPPVLWDRVPPIRERKNTPTSWLSITLKEGRNRQVRRMTAHVGYPTLRLVRQSIGEWCIDGLAPGECKQITVDI